MEDKYRFNLEEWEKDKERILVTRDGHKARILCTDMAGCEDSYPVIALVYYEEGKFEKLFEYTRDGRYIGDEESEYDLYFAPRQHESWGVLDNPENPKYFNIFRDMATAMAANVGMGGIVAKITWED